MSNNRIKLSQEAGTPIPSDLRDGCPPSDSPPPVLTADETWRKKALRSKPKKKSAGSDTRWNLKKNSANYTRIHYTVKNGTVCVANPIASYRGPNSCPLNEEDPLKQLWYRNPCTPSCTALGHPDDEIWQTHMSFVKGTEVMEEWGRELLILEHRPSYKNVWRPLSLYKYYKDGFGEKRKAELEEIARNQWNLDSLLQEQKFTDFEKHSTATAHVTESSVPLPPIKKEIHIKGEIDNFYDMPTLIPEMPTNCLEDPFENIEQTKPILYPQDPMDLC